MDPNQGTTDDVYEVMDDPLDESGCSYEELQNVPHNPTVYQGLESHPTPPPNQTIPLHIAPVVTNQQPSVNPLQQTAMQPLQQTAMQPLHAQFQVAYNPNQNPQRHMSAMPYVAAPNLHGMQYLPQAAGFGPQQQPLAAEPITHQPAITHAAAATTRDSHLKLPRYALTMSVVVYVIFVALICWIPGNLCLIPAMVTAIMAVHKHDSKEYVIAKKYAMSSIILTVIFITTFPLLVAATVISSIFGGTCGPSSSGQRPTYCPG